jgi:exonuclease III
MQKEEDPDILLLSETKMDKRRLEFFRWKLGMTNFMVKNCEGQSGGLAVFWKTGVKVHFHTAARLYMDMDVEESDGFVWRFTGVYGEPKSDKKDLTWRAMRVLNAQTKRPWLMCGDFNEILLQCEKEGGEARPQASMDKFKQALEDCELADLGFIGDAFTWRNNSHRSEYYIRERLDRAVANMEWRSHFPGVVVKNGNHYHSDHRPVIVTIEREVVREC